MNRILFVDDEPNVIDGLRRSLRRLRHEWDMVFVTSGSEALAAAAQQPFDVIVTDMRMPEMDGAELLQYFHRDYPDTVRFILSGYAELESVMRTVPIAHQFLTKPCEPETLRYAVARAFELRELLNDDRVAALVGGIETLPSRPAAYTAILDAIADPKVEMGQVIEILESDLAISSRLLQLVNSSFFGLSEPVADTRRAASLLGLNTLRDLVLSIEVFRVNDQLSPRLTRALDQLHTRSMWTGAIASSLVEQRQLRGRAFTAGMLHDIGLLVLAECAPRRLEQAMDRAAAEGESIEAAEQAINGVTHAEVGAYLLGVWGLPYPILEAAAYHHRPSELPQEGFSDIAAVHVAHSLVRSQLGGEFDDVEAEVDEAYLNQLGIAGRLPQWRDEVERRLAEGSTGR